MVKWIEDVSAFHRACDIPIETTPRIPHPARQRLRASLIDEEINRELIPAIETRRLLDIADGIVDSIYVLIGAAIEYGIPLERVWNAVQAANMAKVDPTSGKVLRRDDGKILKPHGWKPPNIEEALWPQGDF